MERLIGHLDMDAFFASMEQRYDPRLRGKPVAVCGNPKSRTVVAACSYEAKAYGVANGMSTHEAAQRCPGLVLVKGDPSKYLDCSRRIFALLARYTPLVEVFSIDEAFFDLTSTMPHLGPDPTTVAREIKRAIRAAHGVTGSIGLGPNKLIAKLASKLRKPDGLVWIQADGAPTLLAGLPVQKLCGVGARLQAALNEMGITTCAELGAAPEELLVARFGVIGRTLKMMGQGRDDRPVVPSELSPDAKSMGHAYTLPQDTDAREVILGTLLRLSEQTARRVRVDGATGRTVGLTVRYRDFTTFARQQTLTHPTDSGVVLYRAAAALFERYCEPLRQRVRLLGVGLSQLSRGLRQATFLDDDAKLAQIDRCLDAVNDQFGEWTLMRAGAYRPLVRKTHGFLHKLAPRRPNK